jgi:hypothetical protein
MSLYVLLMGGNHLGVRLGVALFGGVRAVYRVHGGREALSRDPRTRRGFGVGCSLAHPARTVGIEAGVFFAYRRAPIVRLRSRPLASVCTVLTLRLAKVISRAIASMSR